jgi:hypothetical protein
MATETSHLYKVHYKVKLVASGSQPPGAAPPTPPPIFSAGGTRDPRQIETEPQLNRVGLGICGRGRAMVWAIRSCGTAGAARFAWARWTEWTTGQTIIHRGVRWARIDHWSKNHSSRGPLSPNGPLVKQSFIAGPEPALSRPGPLQPLLGLQ